MWEVNDATSVPVQDLETGSNFYGVTASDYQSAIADKAPKWWEFPNCASTGCQEASLTVYVNGERIQTNVYMTRP